MSPMSDKKATLQKAIVKNGIANLESGFGGGGIFSDCINLKDVILPSGLIYIGQNCFINCKSLTNISLPDSVTSIEAHAFRDCSSLTSITISNSVKSIGYDAFGRCSSLTNITIPESVTSIEQWAFKNCSSLTNIMYKGTKEQWNNIDKSITSGEVDWCDSTLKTITCTDGVITL